MKQSIIYLLIALGIQYTVKDSDSPVEDDVIELPEFGNLHIQISYTKTLCCVVDYKDGNFEFGPSRSIKEIEMLQQDIYAFANAEV